MGNTPDRLRQTDDINGHGLTVVEGLFHDLVWRCRFCGERRHEKLSFMNTTCE